MASDLGPTPANTPARRPPEPPGVARAPPAYPMPGGTPPGASEIGRKAHLAVPFAADELVGEEGHLQAHLDEPLLIVESVGIGHGPERAHLLGGQHKHGLVPAPALLEAARIEQVDHVGKRVGPALVACIS